MRLGSIECPSCLLACYYLSLVITTLVSEPPGRTLGRMLRDLGLLLASPPIFGPLLASTSPEGLRVSWKIRAWESIRLGVKPTHFSSSQLDLRPLWASLVIT